ncbi:UDP-3-O-acylglucosamine N-acyltransferase [Hyella patelloides LEGE 07179]|uniref:UDP-3-O-acylglucosamine N-acyltransferase n=1 Tax=Hyella patelloides LEGE 07179 TaxID=945734 RepID=A0A563VU56_9CYAN|nr:UDP-3-O-(3-hydroxymyristoyl)glucosamine N-acyltransferase [Hyella patelloides]VEP14977.1 UDP-3-O-acylglucosamine N-acyltransferase [Hyella patelloides LEGE 07179]
MKFQELIACLGDLATNNSLQSNPDRNPDLTGIAAIKEAQINHLSYIEGAKFASMLAETAASALILPQDETLQQQATNIGIAWIATKQPRLLFAKAIAFFYQPYQPDPGIHPTAIIDSTTKIGKDVYIGAYAVIQQNVTIGDRVSIHPQVTIYPDVIIGNNTILYSNSTIQERSQIGANCVIHSGAVIGAEGFGFVPTATGWEKMEQSGYTVLEDGVEIGCNSAVDRPAVGETRIKANTKLDNLVQIGHGCTVGRNCALAAQVGLAGGVTVEDGVLLGGQVGVANQITIGKGTIVTAQSGVTHNIKPDLMVTGTPAYPSQDFRKSYAIFKRLPEIYAGFKKLKKFLLSDND